MIAQLSNQIIINGEIMKNNCDNPRILNILGEKMDNSHSYDEWEFYSNQADEICLKIAECSTKCGCKSCWGLQHSDELQTQWEQDMADNSIIDTLPDDEIF